MLIIFGILLTLFSIYSYALVDPNITLISHPLWTNFRNVMVNFGYYQRENSALVFGFLVIGLAVFKYWVIKYYKKLNVLHFAAVASLLSIVSYPFLSHDFFNYLFDAKILTFYHQNPYLHKALDFPHDPWIRFMHWTIRTYPYGPTFLPITLIPSFLAMGKFILNFLLFKGMFAGFYFLAVYYLHKIDKKTALFFATQPLVIVEGLINSHNDLLAVSLGIIGVYYILKENTRKGSIFLLFSAGIKYITAPVLLLPRAKLSFSLTLLLILYLSFTSEIQPWYFLNLLIFLPYYPKLLKNFSLFFTGLILSYLPFVRYGDWTPQTIEMKHIIIALFFILNLIWLARYHTHNPVKITFPLHS